MAEMDLEQGLNPFECEFLQTIFCCITFMT